jgi:hypothetical protein
MFYKFRFEPSEIFDFTLNYNNGPMDVGWFLGD